jgi:hypothetical protein
VEEAAGLDLGVRVGGGVCAEIGGAAMLEIRAAKKIARIVVRRRQLEELR